MMTGPFIALQLDSFLRPDIIWILIPGLALSIPIIAILMEPLKARQKIAERREVRAMYERLAHEKLDVLRTAITMGFKTDELADLDARLERLVGTERMREVTHGRGGNKAVEMLARELGSGVGEFAKAVESSLKVKD